MMLSFDYEVFCSFFCQRFLNNQWADSRQILHTGVLWFRMCLLPFQGLAAPGEGRGKWNFCYCRGEFLHFGGFWAISQQCMDGSTPNFTCVGTISADVPLLPLGFLGDWGVGGEGVKNSKNGGWSHSCSGQLPFLFFWALPNLVQYVGQRPAHILV